MRFADIDPTKRFIFKLDDRFYIKVIGSLFSPNVIDLKSMHLRFVNYNTIVEIIATLDDLPLEI